MGDSEKNTIEILKDIRDELRGVRGEVRELRVDTGQHLEANAKRVDLVATTLLDLAGQNRLVVRYTRELAVRNEDVESRLSALESRVEKLESK